MDEHVYVYIIRRTGSNEYKIGYSKHPEQRRRELQVAQGRKLEVVATYGTYRPIELETFLHDLLHPNRLRGEWFDLSPSWLNTILFEVHTRYSVTHPHLFDAQEINE